ncbi:MAG: hypothetical protein Q8K70_06375 [Bacteroidota bacterium]|nr:hypothetical protein [Bacteroidota bacterium]
MEKKVLIISHTFPPSPGVGGRRWAKFAKYLNRQGVNVYVLKEERIGLKEESIWTEDINELNANQIFTYKTFYPKILQKKTLSFWDKFQYKIAKWFVAVFSEGNPLDKTIFIKKRFLKQLKTITQTNNIKNIIVSGAPFNLLYYSALFKLNNPHINLICDFRDPWTWGQNYGIKLLSKKRLANEFEKEIKTIICADLVIVPGDSMLESLNKTHSIYSKKYFILNHGYDKEYINPKKQVVIANANKVRIAFLGEIYNEIDDIMKQLAIGLSNNNSPFFLDFYSTSSRYESLFDEVGILNKKVSYHSLLSQQLLFKELENYDFVLIIHPKVFKDNIATKFYELIYFNIPILYIGESGLVSDFINQKKLGLFIDLLNVTDFFSNPNAVKKYSHSPNNNIENYSIDVLSKKLTQKLV